MSDALSRILSSGIALDEVQSFLNDGLSLEEIESAVGRIQARGEDVKEGVEEKGDVRPDDFSDVGNMETFAALNAGRLLYTDSRGWLCWDGLRWAADDHQAHERAVQFSRAMLDDARNEYRAALHAQAEAKAQEDEESLERFTAAVRRGPKWKVNAVQCTFCCPWELCGNHRHLRADHRPAEPGCGAGNPERKAAGDRRGAGGRKAAVCLYIEADQQHRPLDHRRKIPGP